jgi:flagellar P-ring protein precursor FlgI
MNPDLESQRRKHFAQPGNRNMSLLRQFATFQAILSLIVCVLVSVLGSTAAARPTLKNICHVKGQEENVLQGLGLVTGLNGTGDGGNALPTIRSLATAMQVMGTPLGDTGLAELKDVKNVALVTVSATVPAAGARQGDRIDCTVSAISAKSLKGGKLMMYTPLMGPRTAGRRVFAFAGGLIHLDSGDFPTVGRIPQGCRLEEDFRNEFWTTAKTADGNSFKMFTLVLDRHHADFQTAQDVAELITSQLGFGGESEDGGEGTARGDESQTDLARAVDAVNITVRVPGPYEDDPVGFVSQVLSLQIPVPQPEARVIINERAGSIVVSGDVEIGPIAVAHKGIIVSTEAGIGEGKQFIGIDATDVGGAKLQALLDSLNAINATTEDIIEIIKGINRNGSLHGKLIVVE